jgi:hypothetical protein
LAARVLAAPALRGQLAERALTTIANYDWSVVADSYARDLYVPLCGRSV